MLETLGYLIAIVAVVVGTAFSAIGVLGLVRMPDVYTRLHATGKVGVFGGVLLLIAAIFIAPLNWSKALVLMALLMIAGPIVSHAISSAAYRLGIPMKAAIKDELAPQRVEAHDRSA